jgi:hypothetical protein
MAQFQDLNCLRIARGYEMAQLVNKLSRMFGVPKPLPSIEKLSRIFSIKPIQFTVGDTPVTPSRHHQITPRHENALARVTQEPEPEHEHDPHDPSEHDSSCPTCQSEQCPECGETYGGNREPVVESNGNRGCTGCSATCDDCSEWTSPDDLQEVQRLRNGSRGNTVSVCPDCRDNDYFHCADCRDWFHDDFRGGDNPQDEQICQNCSENYFNCDNCNNTFDMDHYGSDGMCQDCAHDDPDPDDHEGNVNKVDEIHSYGYDPKPLNFHGTGRHYGVENEVVMKEGDWEDLESKAKQTLKTLNRGLPGSEDFAYLKSDSSLHGEGTGSFEIVTHPATLDIQKERWLPYLEKPPSNLISHDAGCCGLHVHVEKKGLSELTIGKMLAFVNSSSNAPFVEAIARRTSQGYAKLDPTKKVSDISKPGKGQRTRYEAINLQNPHTVEFRIFKGTLNPKSFVRSLEFVDAVVEFAKPAAHGIQQMHGTDAFFQYVSQNRKRWPLLAEFCHNFANTEYQKGLSESMESAQLSRRGRNRERN